MSTTINGQKPSQEVFYSIRLDRSIYLSKDSANSDQHELTYWVFYASDIDTDMAEPINATLMTLEEIKAYYFTPEPKPLLPKLSPFDQALMTYTRERLEDPKHQYLGDMLETLEGNFDDIADIRNMRAAAMELLNIINAELDHATEGIFNNEK